MMKLEFTIEEPRAICQALQDPEAFQLWLDNEEDVLELEETLIEFLKYDDLKSFTELIDIEIDKRYEQMEYIEGFIK